VLRMLDGDGAALLMADLNALRRADYAITDWEWHERYNAAQGWTAPVDEAEEDGVLSLLREAGYVDAVGALEQHRADGSWRAPPWSAHVLDRERPPCRIDFIHSRAPSALGGRRLVPLTAAVEHNCRQASDHQPIVVDFEATAYDAGE